MPTATPRCGGTRMRNQSASTRSDTKLQVCATIPTGWFPQLPHSHSAHSVENMPRLHLSAAISIDTGQFFEIDFTLISVTEVRMTSCNSLRAINVPPHRQRPVLHRYTHPTILRSSAPIKFAIATPSALFSFTVHWLPTIWCCG